MEKGSKDDAALEVFRAAFKLETKGDIEGASKLYKKSAKLGMSGSYVDMRNIYDDVMEPRDSVRAVASYKAAVALGDRSGAWCLAVHYRHLGKRRWYEYWLKIAADMGEEDAMELQASIENEDAVGELNDPFVSFDLYALHHWKAPDASEA
jgi:TPR repeat protein